VKWFQVDGDTPNDPKMKALIRRGLAPNAGQAAIGAVFLLWCFVAWHGEGEPGEGVRHGGQALDLQDMADECLFDSVDQLKVFLDHLAERGHIDAERWRGGVVFLPAMHRRGVTYQRSKGYGPLAAVDKANAGQARPVKASKGLARPGKASAGQRRPETAQHNTTKQNPTNPEGGISTGDGSALPFDSEDNAQALVKLWNATRKPGPMVQAPVSDSRMAALRRAMHQHPNLDDWRLVIEYANGEPWANAKGGGNHANYRMALDDLARPGKFGAMLDRARAAQLAGVDQAGGRDAAKGRTGAKAGEFNAAMMAEEGDGGEDGSTGE
jgi:hypothetical protein